MKIKLPEVVNNEYIFNIKCPECGKESTQTLGSECPPSHFLSECGCGHGVDYYPIDDPYFEIEVEVRDNKEITCKDFKMPEFLEWLSRNCDKIESINHRSINDISKSEIIFKSADE